MASALVLPAPGASSSPSRAVGADDPALPAAAEHAETYLRWVFSFIGVAPAFIRAYGISAGQRAAALSGALKSAAEPKAA